MKSGRVSPLHLADNRATSALSLVGVSLHQTGLEPCVGQVDTEAPLVILGDAGPLDLIAFIEECHLKGEANVTKN